MEHCNTVTTRSLWVCFCSKFSQIKHVKTDDLFSDDENDQWMCPSLTFQPHFGRSEGSGCGRFPSGSVLPVWWGHWSAPDTDDSWQSAGPIYAASSPARQMLYVVILIVLLTFFYLSKKKKWQSITTSTVQVVYSVYLCCLLSLEAVFVFLIWRRDQI